MGLRSKALTRGAGPALFVAICGLVAGGSLSIERAEAAVTCVGVPATIVRGGGNDTIYGTAGSDVIVAGAGNDTIYGVGGNDVICGHAGNDTIYGGEGNDYLRGGDGNDALNGSFGADTLVGVNGGDSLAGGMGKDVLSGGLGNDVLAGGLGNDTVDGGGGQDTAYYPDAAVWANLSEQLTTKEWASGYLGWGAPSGTDTLRGIENVWGSPYGDIISGDGGNNILVGGGGGDSLMGLGGSDQVYGGDGNDYLSAIGLLDCGRGYDRFAAGGESVVVSCEEIW